ncbi:hypothetical protein FIV42_19985 [Persicimonas caeni]|uniref:Uncharacterized protein n=1 Tax=Persicimonas caeni TaxID=2292766 RepID=A0A4Y6PXS0_PERCE|nr:hypothetical protein [Persicimonas caeni]QDG52939.1 hypothetical protein FIV42_19985 [Persicimonas caeni]QED34161.1 hypothetical protein FRD00_19980 [Persicimonas caeni]
MSDHNGNENPQMSDDSPEFDRMLDSIEKAESARKRKGLIFLLIGLIIGAGIFALAFMFRDEVFGPAVDIEEGQQEVIAKTDDPQCRDMIAQVQDLSDRYFKLEPKIEDKLLSEDAAAIQEIRDEVARLQQRLDEIEEFSGEANLRFDESRAQLKEWFDYVELELSFIDRLAREQLAKLEDAKLEDAKLKEEGEPAKEDGTADKAGEEADKKPEGIVVEKGEATKKKEKAEAAKEKKSKKTPEERKQGALVAIHDAFQKFRVWHSSSLHPCGEADEGETPWRPKNETRDSQ